MCLVGSAQLCCYFSTRNRHMYTRIQRHRWEVTQLEATIERNRKHVQRLLQLLCHPVHPMDPKKWQRMDLVLENLKARQVGCMHPGMALAMEEWLAHEVRTHLKARSYRPSQQESTLVQREKQQRRQRAALLRKLQNDWGPML